MGKSRVDEAPVERRWAVPGGAATARRGSGSEGAKERYAVGLGRYRGLPGRMGFQWGSDVLGRPGCLGLISRRH